MVLLKNQIQQTYKLELIIWDWSVRIVAGLELCWLVLLTYPIQTREHWGSTLARPDLKLFLKVCMARSPKLRQATPACVNILCIVCQVFVIVSAFLF